jgi:hypothetical protein
MKGFGAVSRDNGHSRVPAPPERMMGTSATRRALRESKVAKVRIVPEHCGRIDGWAERRYRIGNPLFSIRVRVKAFDAGIRNR